MNKRILVVSSANLDFVQRMHRLPNAGETVIETAGYSYVPGGKGANSAVTFARMGDDCVFCTRLGQDSNGTRLRTIYDGLLAFCHRHRELFSDPEAAKAASGALLTRHLQLREQLAALIEPYAPSDDGFAARFLAEAMLTWTISDTPFERIYEIMAKLIPNRKEDIYEQL